MVLGAKLHDTLVDPRRQQIVSKEGLACLTDDLGGQFWKI
jgi:hypothetical protein